jgi:hypothetical protein
MFSCKRDYAQQKEKKMKLINKLDHDCVIQNVNGEIVTLPGAGKGNGARVETPLRERIQHSFECGEFHSLERSMGDIVGLPSQEDGVFYVVSSMVLDAAKAQGRRDCFAPDSGASAIKNEKVHVQHVIQLIR